MFTEFSVIEKKNHDIEQRNQIVSPARPPKPQLIQARKVNISSKGIFGRFLDMVLRAFVDVERGVSEVDHINP